MGKATRRLSNIRTREVSLVDEGANLRRYIFIKNKGGTDMGKKNAELLNVDPVEVSKLSADVKSTLINRGNEVIEKMKTFLEDVNAFDVSEDAKDSVPSALIEKFEVVVKAMPQFSGDDEEIEDFGLSKIASEIEKAGKKISSSRMNKISEAFNILSGLLDELGHKGSGSTSTSKSATSNIENSHGGGSGMTNDVKTDKRSPEVLVKLAEAELIKANEALEEADNQADAAAIAKAKEVKVKAEEEFKKAKEVKDEADKASVIAKAQKEADDASAALAKAKGETSDSTENTLKQILEVQKASQSKLDAMVVENAELKKKLEEVSKASAPSNAQSEDGDENTEVDKSKNAAIEKGKAGSEFWGNIF